MAGAAEAARRVVSWWSGTIQSLPILALSVHSACNCRCVMCDIWKANAQKRDITLDELDRHVAGMRRLHVQRVMLTGGEPLLHANLFALCNRLQAEGIRVTLVTTGMLIAHYADDIARSVDELVISVDGAPPVHDAIRGVRGGFDRIAQGLQRLAAIPRRPATIVRSVVQRRNHAVLLDTVRAVRGLGVDRLSFLAADVSSSAFNRAERWTPERAAEVALSREQLPALGASIDEVAAWCREGANSEFLAGGAASLRRIAAYYAALAGIGEFPRVTCNAPWVSAVLEPGGQLRPCFFHQPYRPAGEPGEAFDGVLNSTAARAFRRQLDVRTDTTCQRCVCSLSLPLFADA